MKKVICSAIESRGVIRFYYKGGTRLVEPFCYGLHKSTGNEVLRGYQIGGYSVSGEPVGWRLYQLNKITNLVITDKIFSGIREHYNPNDSTMKTIICRI